MSGSRVYRVTLDGSSLIVKTNVPPRETAFYLETAPQLNGLRVPTLEFAFADWLVMEDIPEPLPKERWLADGGVIHGLAALHALPSCVPDALAFRPIWTSDTTARALTLIPARLRPILERLRGAAQPLLAPAHAISGDPNPMNWGVLPDGTCVLFDFGRAGLGTAALDLAITIPGLGHPNDFEAVSSAYRQACGSGLTARDITLAKVWSVVDILSLAADYGAGTEHMQPMLNAIPTWLEGIEKACF